jgi:hypothetical protein
MSLLGQSRRSDSRGSASPLSTCAHAASCCLSSSARDRLSLRTCGAFIGKQEPQLIDSFADAFALADGVEALLSVCFRGEELSPEHVLLAEPPISSGIDLADLDRWDACIVYLGEVPSLLLFQQSERKGLAACIIFLESCSVFIPPLIAAHLLLCREYPDETDMSIPLPRRSWTQPCAWAALHGPSPPEPW